MSAAHRSQVLIIGSGAGGAVTAFELAHVGYDVTVVEEGHDNTLADYGAAPTVALARLYRRRGMTPILGRTPIGYVEGCCVGGSTEINSGFWHRATRETLLRWQASHGLADADPAALAEHYEWAETRLGVGLSERPWPRGSALFARAAEALGWNCAEVPRAAPGCRHTNTCAQGCPTGAKRGVSRALWPDAQRAGARLVPGWRVVLLTRRGRRVTGAVARSTGAGPPRWLELSADHIFVCCGPTETPALLYRSGLRFHVGNTLRIHPYLKVAARFPEPVDAERAVLPLLQVSEFSPELSLGGAYFTRGHLAMTLSEDWPRHEPHMRDHRHMAMYYVGVRGSGRGTVRPTLLGDDATLIRYDLSPVDEHYLNVGLSRLALLLLGAGATTVCPAAYGVPPISSALDAVRFLDHPIPQRAMSLVTVHAFASCPIGERRELCAADSFGRIYGCDNLYINDASMLPDSPGVNPQGTIMALARRNALHFLATQR